MAPTETEPLDPVTAAELAVFGYLEDITMQDFDEDWNEREPVVVGQRFEPEWTELPGQDWTPDLEILSNPGLDLMREADQRWIVRHASRRDFLFLDPVYLLASVDPNDTGRVMQLLNFLSRARGACGCGFVFTHQLTDKHADGNSAARLLGSTFFHGWYEAAIFTSRTEGGCHTPQKSKPQRRRNRHEAR